MLLSFFIIYSCQVEEINSTPTTINTDGTFIKINPIFLTHKFSHKKIKPIWKSAIILKNGNAIELNFTIDKKYYKPLSKNGKIIGRQRLLLTLEEGLVKETIIEYRPSNDFTGDIKEINSGNFKKNNFEGEISFKKPKDDYAIIWEISSTKQIQKSKQTNTKKTKNTDKTAGLTDCHWEEVAYWVCVGSGIEESCSYSSESLLSCTYIYDEPDPNQGVVDPYDCNLNSSWPWCDGNNNEGDPTPNNTLPTDPCSAAATTSNIFQNSSLPSARSTILSATTGVEHSITFGINSTNKITQAPMNNGGTHNVNTNTTWPGAFAAMHNHIQNDLPISGGDIYTAVTLNTGNNNFTTSFIILPDGSTYAIVVTDLAAAKAFVSNYPADIRPGYNPEFPDFIFDQIEDLKKTMGYGVEARTKAIAFVLDKNKAGITLMKQDNTQNFTPYKTQETIQNGITTFSSIPCK